MTIPASAPTSLAEERIEQQERWKLRPRFQGLGTFDDLLAHEFLDPAGQHASQGQALRAMVDHAVAKVPYYTHLFAGLGLSARDIAGPSDLPRLPILSKTALRRHAGELVATGLPPGQEAGYFTQSSGTTGRPVRIRQTRQSVAMFAQLKQRELRWFRFDPSHIFAVIRLPSQLPVVAGQPPLPPDQTLNLSAWPHVGHFFKTGPARCFSVFNPIDVQADWIDRHGPAYLLSYPETFEHLSFAWQDRARPDYLRGLLAISEQLTPEMRRRTTATLGAPLHQNYGLNEIGLVASRCREGGRYHVHTEHSFVEIVDEDGSPCAPGEIGRIVVTTLTNRAMPLLRYDTGDLAEAVGGPCRCGRTLPSFGEVIGRYSRIAFLPEKTLDYVGAIRGALGRMEPALSANLRQFQIHQFRDLGFELRLVAPGGLPPAFAEQIHSAWRMAVAETTIPLRVVEIAGLARGPGGKFQDFTSDFFPAPDSDPVPLAMRGQP